MIKYIEAIFKYLCAAYRTAVSNYLPIVTVVIVITLSLLLPNKVNKNNELKEINQVLGHMTVNYIAFAEYHILREFLVSIFMYLMLMI